MVQVLTGPRFARAVRAGALAVVKEQDSLNRINVFPVPDADTGANLASTLRAAAAALSARLEITVGQSARTVADAALDGARGNSGAILAQFFHGMAEAIGSRVHLSAAEFGAVARRAADAAQQAMSKPVEGTILSVLRAWAAAIEEQAGRIQDFKELLAHGLVRAREALANTPKQLAILAKHGVVDAGAQGFVYFLEGISSIFRTRAAANWPQAGQDQAPVTPFAAAHAELDDTFRFCAEALLSGERLDRKCIAAAIEHLGGSLVVAGGGSRVRVHLHTNEPQRLFETLAALAAIERTKIDDMVLQQLAARQARVALVTDSSCDVPETLAHRIGLVRVPLSVSFGEEIYTDGVDITPLQFYEKLRTSPHLPKTSQPAVGDFRATYARLLETHDGVLSLHLSSGLSGTYEAARSAASQVDAARITVIDTRQIAGSLGLVAEAVGDVLARGATLEQAAATAVAESQATRLFAVFGTLDLVVRGGRLHPSLARLARWLRVHPIISIDEQGKGAKIGARLGMASAMRALASYSERFAAGKPVRAIISHANAIAAAEKVAEQLCRCLGLSDIPIVNLASVLAAHTGPGAIAVSVRRLEVSASGAASGSPLA